MINSYEVDAVFDLSDEPILDYPKRFNIACKVLNEGKIYEGPDFKFEPVTQLDIVKKPSLKIIGTGQNCRIMKISVSHTNW